MATERFFGAAAQGRRRLAGQPWRLFWLAWLGLALCWLVSACGGGGGSPATPAPPFIASQPISPTVVPGAAATFSVTVTGDSLGYQWQTSIDSGSNWSNIAGATAASYTIAVVDASFNGDQFRVVVSGPVTSVTSSAVTLTVSPTVTPPVIVTQPASATATTGGTASFAVTATGTALNYQWQASTDSGATWADIGGATGTTLALNAVASSDNGKQLRVLVSNIASSVTSNAATLTVQPVPVAPIISAQPQPASVVAPATATFAVTANGTPTPSYQWRQSIDGGATYSDISGATSASYTTPATALADNGTRLLVHVFNSAGAVDSDPAMLTVAPALQPPAITAQPTDQTVTAPAAATFSVAATGIPTPTYQWQVSTDAGATFVNINGATAASYTTSATAASDSGKSFRVVVSNSQGTVNSQSVVLTVTPVVSAVVLTSGRNHVCAIQMDHSVVCWGYNASGQLGDGTTVDKHSPTPVLGLSNVISLARSQQGDTSCALKADGTVACWGNNQYGQLGDGTLTNRTTPVTVPGLSGVVDLSTDGAMTCAVKADGSVVCWGGGSYILLGNGSTYGGSLVPQVATGLSGAVAVSIGNSHTCALKSDGTTACWGVSSSGALGLSAPGTGAPTNLTPVSVYGVSGIVALQAVGTPVGQAAGITYALQSNNSLLAWGVSGPAAATVAGSAGASFFVSGGDHLCIGKTDGTLACEGSNSYGQLGNGGTLDATQFTTVLGLSAVAAMTASAGSTCALNTDGSVACWGLNSTGQVGDGTTSNRLTPTGVPGLTVLH